MERYLLAVVPPSDTISFINHYRSKYAKYTDYIIPPHLTVYPPFYSRLPNDSQLIEVLNITSKGLPSFRVNLDSVAFFEGKNNVAFFKPDCYSTASLRNLLVKYSAGLNGKINNVWPDYPTDPQTFIPHLTIAEHIPDIDFVAIKDNLKNLQINKQFTISSIILFRKQDRLWSEAAEVKFS